MNNCNYVSPDISIYEIGNNDVITTSFDGGDTNGGDDDELDW